MTLHNLGIFSLVGKFIGICTTCRREQWSFCKTDVCLLVVSLDKWKPFLNYFYQKYFFSR